MNRNRAWLLAGAAVLLPAAALCWLQYRSLDELEAKTHAAVRDSLRLNLERLRREMESRLAAIASEALSHVQQSRVAALPAQIDRAFLITRCDTKENCALLEAFRSARPARGLEFYQYQHRDRARCGSCHQPDWLDLHESALYVFRPVPDSTAIAGIRIRSEYLSHQLLTESLAAIGAQDPKWTARLTTAPSASSDQVVIHAGELLPYWSLVGEYEGSTIHSLARAQLRRSVWLWSLVLAALLAGIAFTMRAAARDAQLARMKAAFVSNISHEMKTPLATIRAFAETLEAGRVRDAARRQDYYRAIHKESLRLSELMDNVLDLARLESGGSQMRFELTDPARLVETACDTMREHILAAGFELSVRVDRPLTPVRADLRAIHTVLLNLLSNAVKYSRDRRRVDVTVSAQGGEVHIAVADQGIGISATDRERIFEKFYRASDTLVHDVKGAGLGLALAREIAEAHHGAITVTSTLGEGSVFTLNLPSAAAIPQREASPIAESSHC